MICFISEEEMVKKETKIYLISGIWTFSDFLDR